MKRLLLIVAMLSAAALATDARVTLPRLFQDGMVVQRGRPIPVWGKQTQAKQSS